jgi:hypothetical protein
VCAEFLPEEVSASLPKVMRSPGSRVWLAEEAAPSNCPSARSRQVRVSIIAPPCAPLLRSQREPGYYFSSSKMMLVQIIAKFVRIVRLTAIPDASALPLSPLTAPLS